MSNSPRRSFAIEAGKALTWNQKPYVIKSIKPLLRDITLEGKGGIELSLDTTTFYNEIAAGSISFPDCTPEATSRTWTEREQQEAEYRLELVQFAVKLEDCSAEQRSARIAEFCKGFGRKTPAPKTLKAYQKDWINFGFAGLVPDFSRRGGSGWSSKQHLKELAAKLLGDFFLKDDKVNLTTITALLNEKLRQRNEEMGLSESLARKTVSRILMSMPRSSVKGGRLDPRTYALWNRQAKAAYDVKQPFERVEIDAKTIQVMCRDWLGNLYTEVTLYAMVCARTSYPIGLYVTPGKPSQYTLLKLFETFFSPKDAAFKERFGIKTDWVAPCAITTVVLDNASENASDLALEIVRKMGIQIHYARIARGDDKPHVESFFNTLDKRLLHKLPGATKSSDERVQNRQPRAVKEACLSVEDIYVYLMQFVADVYLLEPATDLGFIAGERMSIKTMMDRDLETFMPLPAPSVDEIKSLLLNVHREQRRVQHYGIDFGGFTYNSNEFANVVRETNIKLVEIQFNPEDCLTVYAVHPVTHQRIELQNKMVGMPRVSFETARQLKKAYSGSAETMAGHDYQQTYARLLNEFVTARSRKTKIKDNNRSLRKQLKLVERDDINAELKKGLRPSQPPISSKSLNDDMDEDFSPSPRKEV
ncbi:Mu transposase C-terminal domain-containing protein [Halopseudomonas laoshanensis]|uniref:Mu transposase C-terminal domain-containing protein n=1 Tax=Halopseudomonas laoshanensis TaxID=2268758 RepID=UPI003735C82A